MSTKAWPASKSATVMPEEATGPDEDNTGGSPDTGSKWSRRHHMKKSVAAMAADRKRRKKLGGVMLMLHYLATGGSSPNRPCHNRCMPYFMLVLCWVLRAVQCLITYVLFVHGDGKMSFFCFMTMSGNITARDAMYPCNEMCEAQVEDRRKQALREQVPTSAVTADANANATSSSVAAGLAADNRCEVPLGPNEKNEDLWFGERQWLLWVVIAVLVIEIVYYYWSGMRQEARSRRIVAEASGKLASKGKRSFASRGPLSRCEQVWWWMCLYVDLIAEYVVIIIIMVSGWIIIRQADSSAEAIKDCVAVVFIAEIDNRYEDLHWLIAEPIDHCQEDGDEDDD